LWVARRLSRRDFDVFRFGTAMADGVYPQAAARPECGKPCPYRHEGIFPPAEIAAQPMISAG
jgi:hypothetical protein